MARIFISYSRTDESFARHLAGALSGMGADVWIDIEDIPAGMKWSSAIQEGLDSGDLLIVIISPDSMTSRNVEDEWQYYLDHGKPVVPVLLQPAKIHFQLNRLQYIDFHNQPFDIAINQLYAELRRNGLQLNAPSQPKGTPNLPDFDNLTPEEIDRVLAELQKRRQHFGQGTVPYPPPPAARSSSRLWIIGGVVGVVVVLFIALFAMQNPGAAEPTPPASATVETPVTQVAQGQDTSTPTDQPTTAPTNTTEPTLAPTVETPTATFRTGVNVRRGPNILFSPPFGSYAAGDTVEIVAVNPDRTWYKVQHPDGEGWFLATLATISGDVSNLPVDPGPPLPPGLTADSSIAHNSDWTPVIRQVSGAEMVLVPTGSFQMGTSPADINAIYQDCVQFLSNCRTDHLFDDESPVISVIFDRPFWIDRYEVSNGQYGSSGTYGGSDLPRTNVTSSDAQAFCEARGTRLPTEREWEYASRGPDSLTYPWGETFTGPTLNYCDSLCQYTAWRDNAHRDGYDVPAPVRSFSEGTSWVGAINMAGNVWEWTSTIYTSRPGDGYEDPGNRDASRTLKGSSWNWIYQEARGSSRSAYAYPSSDWYGFRCARDFYPADLP